MNSSLTSILQALFPPPIITIDADTDSFTFTKGTLSQSFEPSLSLSPGNFILAVGERSTAPDSTYVHLFQQPVLPRNYSDLLVAFLRHGVSSVIGGSHTIPPRFEFRVSARLAAYSNGYADGVLRYAALQVSPLLDKEIIVSLSENANSHQMTLSVFLQEWNASLAQSRRHGRLLFIFCVILVVASFPLFYFAPERMPWDALIYLGMILLVVPAILYFNRKQRQLSSFHGLICSECGQALGPLNYAIQVLETGKCPQCGNVVIKDFQK